MVNSCSQSVRGQWLLLLAFSRASHCRQYTSVVVWFGMLSSDYFSRVSSVVCSCPMQRIVMGCMSLLICMYFIPCRCRTCYRSVSYQATRLTTRTTSHSTRCYMFFRCTTFVYTCIYIQTVNMHTYNLCIQSFYNHVARVTYCHVLHFQCTIGFLCCASSLCLQYIHTHIIGDLVDNPLALMLWNLEVFCMHCNHVDYLLPFLQLSYCIPNRHLYSLSNHFILLSWNRCAYLWWSSYVQYHNEVLVTCGRVFHMQY